MRKTLYTTSEYIDALEIQIDSNLYECKGKDFQLFKNRGAAEYDAEWLVKYNKDRGIKIKKPQIYRVKLEKQ